MIRITRLNHVSLLVADTQRALGFYHNILNLPVIARPDLGFPGAWLDIGNGQQIHLLEIPGEVAGKLPEHGIGYTLSRSGRRALFCRDPDGNAIELVEA